MALNLTSSANARMSWQFNYHLALLYEALEELPEAEAAINQAFHHVYFNEILARSLLRHAPPRFSIAP